MFEKVLVANRGEIAIRIIRALGRWASPRWRSTPSSTATRCTSQRADEAYLLGGPTAAESYLNVEKILEVCRESGAEAVHPGYGFLAENAPLRPGLRGRRHHLHRAARQRDRGDGLQDARARADAGRRRADRARARPSPVATRRGRAQDHRRRHRLPGRGQGRGRRRRQGLPRRAGGVRARGRLRGRRARGREVLLRRDRLPRALPARPAPRRGPGPRRPPRQRHPPRRARLLGPAPPPEGHRGVARAGGRRRAARAHRQDRRRGRARRRLRRRRHDRGPARRTASTSSWR